MSAASLVLGATAFGCSSSDSTPSRHAEQSPLRVRYRGDTAGFERLDTGRVRPLLDPEHARNVRHPTDVELPEHLGAPARVALRDGSMAVAVTLVGASPVAGRDEDGTWIHRGGAPGGGDVSWRPLVDGVEDHVSFGRRPSREAVRYRVGLEGVAGLRLVDDTLELLDSTGTPRLRMARPWIADRGGRAHWASVGVDGCKVDTDPRAPWGRAPVPPGASECELSLDWTSARIGYPAVLDPAWTSTGNMAEPREYHGAAKLPNGRVLVAGGWKSGYTAGAEIYDPTTMTFAATGSMTETRAGQGFILLGTGKVLAVGGWGAKSTAELYDPSSGTWTATGSMAVGRNSRFVTLALASGKILVAGGTSSLTTELYDPASGTFTPTGNFNFARYYDFDGTLLKDGRVFICGSGTGGNFRFDGEIYDPATGNWTVTASMKVARTEHKTILLPDGRVLVPGGVYSDAIKYVEIYDPAANTWTVTPNLKIGRRTFAGGLLPDGRAMVVGGEMVAYPFYTETAEIYDPAANTWTFTSPMAHGRYAPSWTLLNDGSVLVAGGYSDLDGYLNDAQVFRILSDGEACSIDIDCSSGHCVDGVCCATTCTGSCQACSAALKTSGADGTCGPAKLGTADSACAPQADAPCGYVGTCDGQGSCSFATQGTNCATQQCSSGSLSSFACNGLGACTQTSASCAPYVCGTATSCATSCASDAECAASAWCDAGTCKPDSSAGTACTSDTQCLSGHCVDSYCCDKACDSGCEACSSAKTGGANGSCLPVGAGTDPNDDCPDDGASSCNRDGMCDGKGSCRQYASGIACSTPGCVGNTPATFACDGNGTCVPALGSDCGAYLCSGSACTTACTTDDQCAPGARCSSGTCAPLAKLGDKCSAAEDCISGFCADGYCCNATCDGQCEACDVQGGEGHCIPVAGPPHGARPACSAGDANNPCSAAVCDGVDRTACKDFVGSSVSCRAASCSAGVATQAAACDGSGQCPAAATRDCSPYACAGDSCATSCSSDAECASPSVCEQATGKCVTPSTCLDDETVQAPNGTALSCEPFRCDQGTCLTSCSSVKDCAASYVCSSAGICQKPSPASDAETSSGCALVGQRDDGAPESLFALLLLGALFERRRRHP